MPRLSNWTLPAGLALAFAAGVFALHRNPVGIPTVPAPLAQAELASGERVALPHDWKTEPERVRALYRLRLEIETHPTEPWSVYLPAAGPIGSLRIGARDLAGVDDVDPDSLDLSYLMVPRLFAVPTGWLVAGENSIEIAMTMPAGRGFLGPVYAAPTRLVRPSHRARTFSEITLLRVSFVAIVSFAVFLGAAWMLRRRDPVPGWLALILLVCASGMWNLVSFDLPVPHPSNTHVGNGWVLALLVGFAHRLAGLRRPRVELAFVAFAVFASATRFLIPPGELWAAVRPPLFVATLAAGGYPLALIARAQSRGLDPSLPFVTAAALIFAVGAAHDLAVAAGAISRLHGLVLPWSLGLAALLFGWVFVRRFVAALDTSEALTGQLEARVAEKERELAGNYERLAVLERERAIASERARLMEELHDGTGGQIASALAMLRNDATARTTVADRLRRALQDMRLIVHSLDEETGDLATLLGMLRDQLEPALDAADIGLAWEAGDIANPRGYSPEMALDVLRIVQEAVTNAIEHAAPSRVRIRTEQVDAQVVVAVEDDGAGLAEPGGDRTGRGRGLANMRRRAARIDGELRLEPLDPGTRVELRMNAA